MLIEQSLLLPTTPKHMVFVMLRMLDVVYKVSVRSSRIIFKAISVLRRLVHLYVTMANELNVFIYDKVTKTH